MKISIVTITFNSEKTISETMQSILEQTYRPLEYILIDGKSTDGTIKKIIEEKPLFEKKGIDFLLISEPDKGISDAFNKGITKATGDIIGIINSDDKLTKNSLDFLSKNYEKKIDVYFGNCIIFRNDEKEENLAKPKFRLKHSSLLIGMSLYHPSTFISKNAYSSFGLYNTNLKYCMDRELLLRLYKSGCNFKYIDQALAYYREGGTNQINYRKCSKENERISIKYGTNPIKAFVIRLFFSIHDRLWILIKKLGAEHLFHRKIK